MKISMGNVMVDASMYPANRIFVKPTECVYNSILDNTYILLYHHKGDRDYQLHVYFLNASVVGEDCSM